MLTKIIAWTQHRNGVFIIISRAICCPLVPEHDSKLTHTITCTPPFTGVINVTTRWLLLCLDFLWTHARTHNHTRMYNCRCYSCNQTVACAVLQASLATKQYSLGLRGVLWAALWPQSKSWSVVSSKWLMICCGLCTDHKVSHDLLWAVHWPQSESWSVVSSKWVMICCGLCTDHKVSHDLLFKWLYNAQDVE